MNTTLKGDKFEDQVYLIFKDLLSNGDFFLNSKLSKIHQKKPYYSKDRDSNIITDISIETFLPGSDNYSFLTIIECKNLNKKVSVDDIEEFHSKLNQIGEHNTKGIIVSLNGFQRSTFNYGNSKKIGLAIAPKKDELQWISYRKANKSGNKSPLIISNLLGETDSKLNFCAILNGKTYDNLPDLLIEFKIIDLYKHKPKYLKIDFLDQRNIDSKISKLLENHSFYEKHLNINKLCKYLSESYNYSFEFDLELKDSLLGSVNYDKKIIKIDKKLAENNKKWRFTLAHEIGHLILHSKYSNEIPESIDRHISISEHNDPVQNKRMEIQANIFASHLLIPEQPLLRLTNSFFEQESIYKGHLYLDNQPCNQCIVLKFLAQIEDYFQVSKSVAKYRLIGLNILIDQTDNSIKNFLKKI